MPSRAIRDQEERGARAVARQHVEHARRVARARSVVEGEREARSGVEDAAQQMPAEPALNIGAVEQRHVPRPVAARYSRTEASNMRISARRSRRSRATSLRCDRATRSSRTLSHWRVSQLK